MPTGSAVPEVRADGRVARGDRTRAAVLDVAVVLATEKGLDGLSLGQLAERLAVSKSGLFAHWKSKESLQLATIERARERFVVAVAAPAMQAPRGVRRLRAVVDRWLDYITVTELPGGCFFTNAQFEFDAKPGPVRDRLAEVLAEWMAFLERLAAEAVAAGELPEDVDPRQLAFEVNAIGVAAVYQSRLLPSIDALHRAHVAVRRRLAVCPDPALLPEEPA
jgi:AcrR family transcriptional regulator